MEKFIGLLFIVPSAMLATVSAMAAQNIGAKKPERARKTMKYSIAIAVGFGTVASVILQFIPEYAVRIFTSDSSVITLGGQYLKGYVWDCISPAYISASAASSPPAAIPSSRSYTTSYQSRAPASLCHI